MKKSLLWSLILALFVLGTISPLQAQDDDEDKCPCGSDEDGVCYPCEDWEY